ncbi:YvcK family protein [Patescibacteria group bacterium]|nr:YvcK family protein [Patescibacteria group bacterium]MBU1448460.1 YvcK family protein [Patescibacteria group bacterium]MBU2613003.1 YvcK family protein [Patescibacteria group bacterium]
MNDIATPERRRITVLGGGTGTFTVLTGLKTYPLDLAAVVSSADDGGSTGVLRDELGVLPPGDIRQCLVALSSADEIMRRVFNYRFTRGPLNGHPLGNIFMSALEDLCGNPIEAVRQAHQLLRVRGRVIPVSATASNLYAQLTDKTVVRGEHAIDDPTCERAAIESCFLDPPVDANPDALDVIRDADVLVMGPGDLYTSTIPVLLVDGVAHAVAECRGKRVLVTNLMTKRGQTDGYSAETFVEAVERYLAPGRIDAVILNAESPPQDILDRYATVGEHPVEDDFAPDDPRAVRVPLVSSRLAKQADGDRIRRSVLRHDADKLATTIIGLLPS